MKRRTFIAKSACCGLAPLIARESETIEHIDELLTLEGLRILHARNAA